MTTSRERLPKVRRFGVVTVQTWMSMTGLKRSYIIFLTLVSLLATYRMAWLWVVLGLFVIVTVFVDELRDIRDRELLETVKELRELLNAKDEVIAAQHALLVDPPP